MNPHTEAADTYLREGQAEMAQAEATLALTYEQRTANLIAFNYVGGKLHSNAVHDQINERLGLT